MDVVILAGGAGRRFGGQKQFTEVGPGGETLLELTLADARRAGCRRGVLVVSPEGESAVADRLRTRPISGMDITLAVQRSDDLPGPHAATREKPWGTAHAVWAARRAVTGPFLVFNADDYYGPNAPSILREALDTPDTDPVFALLGYGLGTTLSSDGAVSRAVCETDADGWLTGLREYTEIDPAGRVLTGPETGRRLPLDARVSMNAWAFTPAVFPMLEEALKRFLATSDLDRAECFLPAAVDRAVQDGRARVRVAATRDPWFGLTWPGDRARVEAELEARAQVVEAMNGLGLDPGAGSAVRWGDGLIHTTWLWETPDEAYVLQKLNAQVFADPVAVADTAATAARRVDRALTAAGDTDPRHRLIHRYGPDGQPRVRTRDGSIWRATQRIAGARPVDATALTEIRSAAAALGRFPGLLESGDEDFPDPVLPGFHDTPARLVAFRDVHTADPVGRLGTCLAEADRLLDLGPLASRLKDRGLPERLVHNDAKPDNVLVDERTGEAVCVIDLDTVMPGLAAHDFGDLVRSTVTGRPEDEADLDRITVREDVFVALAEGYCEGAAEWLTPAESAHLVDGALVIVYEQALRFLGDYLAGDVYYPVTVPGHNLRRARAQLRLLEELLQSEDSLRALMPRF